MIWRADGLTAEEGQPRFAQPLTVVGCEAPVGLIDQLWWQYPNEDAVLWDPPTGPRFAGVGTAALFRTHGAERVQAARDWSGRLWQHIRRVTLDGSDGKGPLLVGGLSFAPGNAQHEPWEELGDSLFVLPRLLYLVEGDRAWLYSSGLHSRLEQTRAELLQLRKQLVCAAPLARGGNGTPERRVSSSSEDEWRSRVEDILRLIRSGRVQKIVAGRQVVVELSDDVSELDILNRLTSSDGGTTRFCIRHADSSYFGATPETLVHKVGTAVSCDALAGSASTGSDVRASLLQNHKERTEHDFVVRAIVETLSPLCSEVLAPARPSIRRLPHVQHLHTPILAQANAGRHVLDFVERLHPTPAVAGVPRNDAMRFIREHEPTSRGWHAGAVGWMSEEGDGHFAVSIRSALVRSGKAYVFAGAGIVAGSVWDREYTETELKMQTIFNALQLRPGWSRKVGPT